MKAKAPQHEVQAFLEKGSHLEGNLHFAGIVRINGQYVGEIRSEDSVIIGGDAEVSGSLFVGSAIIGGRLIGDIVVKERLEIGSTAYVEGSIRAPKISIEEGAQIVGDLRVTRNIGSESADDASKVPAKTTTSKPLPQAQDAVSS